VINFVVWIMAGIGWLASIVMRADAQQTVFLNLVVGIVGAFIAGLVLTPILGISTINQSRFSLSALLVSLTGSMLLLPVVNLYLRAKLHRR